MRWRDINYLKDFYNDDIVVFFGNYEDFSEQDICLLSEEEIIRASIFSDSSMRDRYLAGKAFLRRSLGHMLSSGPYQGALAKNEFGKPIIADKGLRLRFNISHTGDVITIAFSFFRPIGIDIELKNRTVPLCLIDYILTDNETANLLCHEDWRYRFLRVWTRKEAVLKCTGLGLLGDLKRIKVPLTDEGILAYTSSCDDTPSQNWHLLSIEHDNQVIGTIAV